MNESEIFVGMQLEEAEEKAHKLGYITRVIKKNGEYFLMTADVIAIRLNFEVENNIITKCNKG